jgi:hypothetical protein
MAAAIDDASDEEKLRYARISHAALNHSDPKIRKQAKQLIKAMHPTWTDPELSGDELREQLVKEVAEPLQKEIKDMKEAEAKRKLDEEWEKAKERIEASGLKFDDVKKVMVDKKIADVDTAAEHLRMQAQLSDPAPESVIPVELPPDIKKLMGNPTATKQYQQRGIRNAMNEVIQARRTGQPLKVA